MTWKQLLATAVALGALSVGGAQATNFYYRTPLTANPADDSSSRPAPFSIPAVTNGPRGAVVASSAVTPTGYTTPAIVTVTGDPSATISIAGGPPARSGTLYPGQSFQLTLTASAAGSATSLATVTVGGASATWSVTTTAPVNTPQAFTIAAVTGAPANTVTTSASVTPSGYTDPSGISISGDASAQISVAGGPWSSSTTISPGQSFQARVTSAPADGSSRTLTVSIGARDATWSVKSVDTTPDSFAIAALTGQAPSTTVTSAPVTMSGIDSPTPITVAGDPSARISVAGSPYATSGTISSGQPFTVQMTTASGPGSQQAVVTVGGVGVAWNVSTRALDTAPDAFTIAATSGVAPGAVGTSAAVTPTGYLDSTSISVTGDASARVSIAGGAYATSGTIAPGQSFTVQMTAGGTADGSTKSATVTIGGITASWSMKVRDQVPDSFAIAALTDQAPNSTVTSAPVTASGIDSPTPITVSGEPSARISVAGAPYATSGTISSGQTFTVQLTTAPDADSQQAVVTVGGVGVAWNVSTRTLDAAPEAFTIAATTGVAPGTVSTSAAVTPTGYLDPAPISVTGDASARVSIAGGAYATSGTIAPGQSFTVQMTAGGTADGSTKSATVTIGGITASWSMKVRDQVPDSFAIAALTDQAPNSTVTSAPVTASGIDSPTPITVSGEPSARISVAGGPYATSGTISSGQTFTVQMTAPAASTSRSTTVTVGGGAATWSVTSRALDTAPDAFAIAAISGVAPGAVSTSAAVTPTGYLDPAPISVTGDASARISIAGGAYATSGTITPGQSFTVQMTAGGAADGSAKTATVTIGGVTASWSMKVQDQIPDAFAIAALTNQVPSTTVTSAPVTTSGIDSPTTITVTGDPSARISVAGGPYATSGTITNGQSFTVQMATASSAGSQQAVVTVGGVGVAWNVSTRALDTVPDAFAIAATSSVAPGAVGTSAAVTPAGYLDPAPISVTGDASARISIAGGAYATSGTITPGQSFTVQMTAGGTPDGSAKTATVSIGGVTASWSMMVQDQTPNSFAIAALTGQAPNSTVTSAPVTASGIDSPTPVSVTGEPSARISVAGGPYATSGTISNGQSFTVQMTTSGTADGSSKTATVTMGGVSASWAVKVQDQTPDAFAIAALTGQAPNSTVTSAPVATSGIDSPTPISVSGDPSARISVAGGPYATSGTISNGQSFTVQMTAPAASTSRSATVTVGGGTATWNVTTRALDTAPDAFAIAATSGVAPGAVGTSAAVTPTGYLDPAQISVTGDASARISIAGGAYTSSGTITPTQSFTVQMTAGGSADGSVKTATVTIGGVSTSWTMKVQDQIPDAFSFAALTGQAQNATVYSQSVTPTGYDATTTVTVAGGGSPAVDINGDGNFQASRTISPGQNFRVRLTNAGTANATTTATANINGVSANFQSTTTSTYYTTCTRTTNVQYSGCESGWPQPPGSWTLGTRTTSIGQCGSWDGTWTINWNGDRGAGCTCSWSAGFGFDAAGVCTN